MFPNSRIRVNFLKTFKNVILTWAVLCSALNMNRELAIQRAPEHSTSLYISRTEDRDFG